MLTLLLVGLRRGSGDASTEHNARVSTATHFLLDQVSESSPPSPLMSLFAPVCAFDLHFRFVLW